MQIRHAVVIGAGTMGAQIAAHLANAGMWAFYAKLKEPKELVVIDGANHLFEGKTPEVGEALEDLLGDYE